MTGFYRREGTTCSLEEWAQAFEDPQEKIVRQEQIGPYWISTIWLGLDHRLSPTGPPLIFETMVFRREGIDDKGLGEEVDVVRYSMEAEAIAGHQALIAQYEEVERLIASAEKKRAGEG